MKHSEFGIERRGKETRSQSPCLEDHTIGISIKEETAGDNIAAVDSDVMANDGHSP
jgi:hypothetical protein